MASLKVVYRAPSSLTPYDRNARTHSAEQIAQIARSIQEFGWTNPILVDESGGIIAGHGRIAAALQLGVDKVPTICISGLTEAQQRALVIADNKLALNAGWDEQVLLAEIEALTLEDFDLSVIGFSDDELAALTPISGTEGLTDPEDAPEPPADPVTKPGDVWLLGRHRITCGDSTVQVDVDRALNGVKPHLMVTDPPYGVKYAPKWRQEAERASGQKVGAGAIGAVLNDDRADWREAWALFPGSVAYVWHAMRTSGTVFRSLQQNDFEVRAEIVWDKGRLVMSRGHYHPQHESCWYAVRGTASWAGGHKQSTVWQIQHMKSETGHGTQKPVECMKRPIENNSSPGQAVYEPFSGSGTTIIACEMTGRACHALELSPAYVDVAVKRWQDFTGQTATLESDGRTFAEVAASKQPEEVPA